MDTVFKHYNDGKLKKIQEGRKNKKKKGTILVPFCYSNVYNPRLYMKSTAKTSFDEVFSNPITRNLILILVSALALAIAVVTGAIIIYNQF